MTVFIIIVALLTAGGTGFLLNHLIYRKKLSQLNASIQELTARPDLSARLPMINSGTLTEVNASINTLLDGVAGSMAELRKGEEHYQNLANHLQQECDRLVNVVDSLPDATFIIDGEKKVIAWNRCMEEMTGIQKEEMLGKGNYAYSLAFHADPSPLLIDLVGQEIDMQNLAHEHVKRKGDVLVSEVLVMPPDGKEYMLWAKASPLRDRNGHIVGAIESIRDITTRSEAEEQLRYLSMHDPLTGLYNRTYFSQEMERLSLEETTPISIIICDVDGLKLVNVAFGLHVGDHLLISAARIISSALPKNAVAARLGSDEFAVLLPGVSRTDLQQVISQIGHELSQYNDSNPDLPLSFSIGSAASEKSLNDLSSLFAEADGSMYHEKLHYTQSTQSATVQILMKVLEKKDFVKDGHVDRLQSLVASVGSALGMTERRINSLRLLAKFHDIGKVAIPDRILMKQGPLTPVEFAEIQRHCEIGFRIAQSAPLLVPIADGILKHHEWWNGKGYPLGLQGKEIPLDCRLLAIADAYDALTSDRPYRKAMSMEKAAAELTKRAGTQFDPELVETFMSVLEKEHGHTKITVLNKDIIPNSHRKGGAD